MVVNSFCHTSLQYFTRVDLNIHIGSVFRWVFFSFSVQLMNKHSMDKSVVMYFHQQHTSVTT